MGRRRIQKVNPVLERPSSSVSPELGFQDDNIDEPSNDTADTINAASSGITSAKKRGPRITVVEDDSNLIAYLEDKITDAFQTVYTTTFGSAGSNYANDMLQAAFNKVDEQGETNKPKIKKIFFEKIEYRLCFVVESLTSIDNRRRIFRFLAKFSVNQWRKGVPDFIDFVVRFCEELSFCEDPAVRQNICTLTGFVLGEGRGHDVIGTARVLSVPIRQKLYSILLDRQLDKSSAVRREVILSVADIQDDEIPNDFPEALERSPKDVILMGLRDSVADCRLTAVFALNIVVPEHADFLIELASWDPATSVRVVAIGQLAKLPLTFLSEQQRMDLLRGIIFDDEIPIKDAVHNVLLSEWLTFIHRVQEKRNRRRAECIDGSVPVIKQEIDESAIMNLSQNLRDMKTDHGFGSAAQGLLSMLDFCDDPEAEYLARSILIVVFDVIREKLLVERSHLTHFVSSLVNDNTFPEVLSTHNYRSILDKSLSGTDQAQYAFFWRILIEYCSEQAENETERLECIYMLAPPLAEMCEMIQKLKTSYEPSVDIYCCDEGAAQICDIQQVAILHLLGILRHLDHKDHIGMSEWRCLLLLILRDHIWSKEITDCAMVDLAEFFFDEKPEQFLATLYDVTAEVIATPDNSSATKENSTPHTSPSKRPRRSLDLRKEDDHTKRFCIQLTHSMLRTGAFTKFSAILQKVYDDIISACLLAQGTQLRIWALEAAGILGALNQGIANEVLSKTSETLNSEEETLKMSIIDVVTDLIAVHGSQDVLKWCNNASGDAESERDFVNDLIDIVTCKTTGPLLCMKTCECLAKIALVESFSSTEHYIVEVLVGLISRMFHSVTSKLPAVKNCLERFFAMFPTNQLLMVMTFHELMSRIRNASGDDFVLRIDIAGALNLLVGSTSKSLLKGSSDRKDTSVQPIFMKEVLNYANEHPEDTCALLYWETAVALDLNEFSSDELKATQKIIMDNVDNVIAIAGGKSKVASEIQKLMRNLEHALRTYSSRIAEETEVADRLTELRERYNQTSARSRRRTPKSSNSTPVRPGRITTIRKKKASTSVKRTTQQLIDGQETPSPPPVTNSLVTPIARTRPVLSRSAKSAAFSKTRRWLFEKNDEDELT